MNNKHCHKVRDTVNYNLPRSLCRYTSSVHDDKSQHHRNYHHNPVHMPKDLQASSYHSNHHPSLRYDGLYQIYGPLLDDESPSSTTTVTILLIVEYHAVHG